MLQGGNGMRVYVAGPLFSAAERAFNLEVAARIERLGFEVFLPQRDGAEADRPPYDRMSREQRRAAMFTVDRDEVLGCDVFLFITDGRVPDEGAAVELGIAYTHRQLTGGERLIIGLRTDTRTAFANAALNPMISQALDHLYHSTEELETTLAAHLPSKPHAT